MQERECQVACPKDSPSPLGVIVPTGLIDLQEISSIPFFLFFLKIMDFLIGRHGPIVWVLRVKWVVNNVYVLV